MKGVPIWRAWNAMTAPTDQQISKTRDRSKYRKLKKHWKKKDKNKQTSLPESYAILNVWKSILRYEYRNARCVIGLRIQIWTFAQRCNSISSLLAGTQVFLCVLLTLSVLSQLPEATAVPSGDTSRQLIRLSWA